MKKVRIMVKENAVYHHQILVDQGDMDDGQFELVIDSIDHVLDKWCENAVQIAEIIEKHGLKIIEVKKSAFPDYSEFEIYEVVDLNEK